MPRKNNGFVLPWWVTLGGITLLLLAYTSPWMRFHYRSLYRFKAWAFKFSEEMTFGVWWTAALFLLAAALLYERWADEDRSRRRASLQLSLVLLAIVIDEVGSIHEWLSGIGGWTALAPFELLTLLLLVDSLRRLWSDPDSRPTFWLVTIGFLLLASVVFQEYAEHNLISRRFNRLYGRFIEETTEVVGAWFILLGAAYYRRRRWLAGFEGVVPDPLRMPHLLPIIVAGFPLHLLALRAPLLDVGVWDGLPSAVYPFIVFILLACYAYWAPAYRRRDGARGAEIRGFWSAAGLMFLACSLGAIHNLWGLLGNLVPGVRRDWFYQPVPTYVALILGAWFFGLTLYGRRNRRPLWLLVLPLTILIFYRVAPMFQMHLAAGFFALVCTAAFLRRPPPDDPPSPIGSRASPAEPGPG